MWRRNLSCHGTDTWVIWKIIQMHSILGLPHQVEERRTNFLLGYCEDTDVIFMYVRPNVYMLQLNSMQSKRLNTNLESVGHYRPFTSFYTPGDFSFLILLYEQANRNMFYMC
jgi:hypothetical protein